MVVVVVVDTGLACRRPPAPISATPTGSGLWWLCRVFALVLIRPRGEPLAAQRAPARPLACRSLNPQSCQTNTIELLFDVSRFPPRPIARPTRTQRLAHARTALPLLPRLAELQLATSCSGQLMAPANCPRPPADWRPPLGSLVWVARDLPHANGRARLQSPAAATRASARGVPLVSSCFLGWPFRRASATADVSIWPSGRSTSSSFISSDLSYLVPRVGLRRGAQSVRARAPESERNERTSLPPSRMSISHSLYSA